MDEEIFSRRTQFALLGLEVEYIRIGGRPAQFYIRDGERLYEINSRQAQNIQARRISELGDFKREYENSIEEGVQNRYGLEGGNDLIISHQSTVNLTSFFEEHKVNIADFDNWSENVLVDFQNRVHNLLSSMAYEIYTDNNHRPDDLVRFRFFSRDVYNAGERNVGYTNNLRGFSELNIQGQVEKMSEMFQSNADLRNSGQLHIQIDTFRNIGGNCSGIVFEEWLEKLLKASGKCSVLGRNIWTNMGKNNKFAHRVYACLESALVYCILWKNGEKINIEKTNFWKKAKVLTDCIIEDGDYIRQRDIRDVKKLEGYLRNRITVLERQNNWVSVLYSGDKKLTSENENENFYLLYVQNRETNEGHYFPIKSSMVGNIFPDHESHKQWCHNCLREDRTHKCDNEEYCPCGLKKNHKKNYINESKQKKICEKCSKQFLFKECYNNHKKKRNGCRVYCSFCGLVQTKNHKCGMSVCKSCNKLVEIRTHECFMPTLPQQTHTRNRLYYDIECEIDSIGEKKIHRPNLVVAELVSDKEFLQYDEKENKLVLRENKPLKGLDEFKTHEDEKHIYYKFVFHYKEYGYDVLNAFCDFIFRNLSKTTIIAHNQKGYDGQFIVDWCFSKNMEDRNFKVPARIYNGGNILYMHYKPADLRFIDSLSFVCESLKKLPATFGLTSDLAKGDYPIFFNKWQNRDYVGEMPSLEYFPNNFKTKEEKKEFLEWYEKRKEQPFNNAEELLKYCEMDVKILRECMEVFRDRNIELSETDPFANITLPGLVLQQVRCLHLKKNQIPLYKPNQNVNTSFKANAYLSYLNTIRGEDEQDILFAMNSGGLEQTVSGKSGLKYKVDGLRGKDVFQFLGCFWHGCPKCTKHNDGSSNPTNGFTFLKLYEKSMRIKNDLEEAGYTVHTIWECEFDALLKNKTIPMELFLRFSYKKTLDPYEAFCGGRTNVICPLLLLKKRGWIANYDDIVSLYPSCNFYGEYPVSLPERYSAYQLPDSKIVEERILKEEYKGLIYCKILPPSGLYHPVLGVKHDNKYIFALCNECMKKKNQSCSHKETKDINLRALTFVWTTHEVKKALELGYQIITVYELWHFPKWERGFMRDYIKKYLRLKIIHNDYKGGLTDEFIARLNEEYGWDLKREDFRPDKALKNIAKLFLNTLWGKFSQNPNYKKNKVITTRKEYIHYLFGNYDNLDLIHAQDNLFEIEYRDPAKILKLDYNISIYIGIFTTSQARLRLYEGLEYWGKRILYFDTDSIIYGYNPNDEKDLKKLKIWREKYCGKGLGQWESEFGDDEHITEFVSIGAKKYSYQTNMGNGKSKFAGIPINLNTENSIISYDSMTKYVEQRGKKDGVGFYSDDLKIHKNKRDKTVYSKAITKKLQFTSDKRVILEKDGEVISIPFGY